MVDLARIFSLQVFVDLYFSEIVNVLLRTDRLIYTGFSAKKGNEFHFSVIPNVFIRTHRFDLHGMFI